MNKILFWCWSVLAFLNLGLWVLDGCADFDTLQIAMLQGLLALHNYK